MITIKWHTALFCLVALGLLAPAEAQVQNWPTRPIKFVVPYAQGGGNDIIARVIGEQLNQSLGQPIIIDNRSGAGGNMGRGVRRQERSGWLHLPGHAQRHSHCQSASLCKDRLRSAQGLHAGRPVGRASRRARGQRERAGKIGGRADRLCQGQSGCALLRLGGIWHPAPSRRGAVQVHDRHQDGAYPLQGRCAGGNRPHRRPSASHVRSDQ